MTSIPPIVELIECPQRREPTPPGPCAMVVFGASGDLTSRLLVPALYNLSRTRLIPERFALIGVARSDATSESWRDYLYEKLKSYAGKASEFNNGRIDEEAWSRLAGGMSYVQGDLSKPELYGELRAALAEAERTHGTEGNVIFYLAVAEQFFCPAIERLHEAGLTDQPVGPDGKPRYWRRVVFEKPFGHSLESARALNARVLRTLSEDQIFRIDHFLGKETVQNIMALRFANGMFEPIWNRDRIDHVQVTVAETVGVEGRGTFYEATGALRDMVPNHVLALVSMVAMEPPSGFDPASIRSRKADVFTAMRPVRATEAVRAQYAAGTVLGKRVGAYRDEPKVARDSKVETYVAMQLEIDNWRWAGVPFFIRTGKHLSQRKTEVAIRFKQAPYTPFRNTPVFCLPDNWLIISIAPDEGISLQFAVKRPGPVVDLAGVRMDFRDNDWFPNEPNVGYETLIYDVMMGDQTLYMRADMVEEAWRVVQPVLDAWAADNADVTTYVSGSEGPLEADGLLARHGNFSWRTIEAAAKRQS
jgi:glucose-6-phosphate 1-dehydrogenase